MAKGTIEVKVGLESIIHSSVAKVIQEIWDKHGVLIKCLEVDWLDVSACGEVKMVVEGVESIIWTPVKGKPATQGVQEDSHGKTG